MSISTWIFKLAFGARLPKLDGCIHSQSINESIEIIRDESGVPYINAQTISDGWYGLGFCEGQDRSFQLEIAHRAVQGTLSEILGIKALPADSLSRRIGFHKNSMEQYKNLDSKTKEYLIAFSTGVNEGRSIGSSKKAHEFTLLRCKPSIFAPEDSLGILKLFAFQMGSNWDSELARLHILINDGPEALINSNKSYFNEHPVSETLESEISAKSNILKNLSEEINSLLEAIGTSGGSNNWALSNQKTESNRPILSNDPHLSPSVPNQWYLAHIQTPEWKIVGAAIVGVPGFASGHNGHSAWGVTAGLADNTDLYIEDIKLPQKNHAKTKIKHWTEEIFVKGQSPHKIQLVKTERGPIIGDSFGFEDYSISMRATWLETGPFSTLVDLPTIKSYKEFENAWSPWPFSTFNMVYADVNNNIGWKLVGDIPIRTNGSGMIPLPAQNNWLNEKIPTSDLPSRLNPDNGIVASANNNPGNLRSYSQYQYNLGNDWVDGYRISRITEVLDKEQYWTVDACMDLQMDVQATAWRDIKDKIISVKPLDDYSKLGIKILREWNGDLSEDSVGASIYEKFMSNLLISYAKDKAPNSFQQVLGKGVNPMVQITFMAGMSISDISSKLISQDDNWDSNNTWNYEISLAISKAIESLQKTYGPNPNSWAWGEVRKLEITHLLGTKKPLNKIFNLGPFKWKGDANTISQAASPPWDPINRITTIASMRMTVDTGGWSNSRFVLAGGQSGNPMSPHYSDMLNLWMAGQGIPIHWNLSDVKENLKHSLHIKPTTI